MDYEYWSSLSDDELAAQDIAFINLTAAIGLPGSESLDIAAALNRLDYWTQLVHLNTEHWLPKFAPEDDCRTPEQYRMMAMITVLQRDIGVRFNPAQMSGPYNAMDSQDQFIHGALTEFRGTCCSLPILYLAIGRRLGYPLRQVRTKGHSFIRWDDPSGERFNVDCAGFGYVLHDDEFYRHWPFPFSERDRADPFYLTSLTPRQELASTIWARACCLRDNMRFADSVQAMYYVARLEPSHKHDWFLYSMIFLIMEYVPSGTYSPRSTFIDAIDRACESLPINPWEVRTREAATEELRRIALLQFESSLSHQSAANSKSPGGCEP